LHHSPSRYLDRFVSNGQTASTLVAAETHFSCAFPTSYKRFIAEHDGGEGFVGEHYLVLWRARELIEFNGDYQCRQQAPEYVLFGTNGSGESFVFDTRFTSMPIRMVPLIGFGREDARLVARDFAEFFEKIYFAEGLPGEE
jgi:hypothetical protein